MALVNTGRRRSMSLYITKKGTDNSNVVMSTTSTPSYPELDGKNAFGAFPLITSEGMQELSDADFTARVNAWKLNIQSEFAGSDPDMWDDISGYFKYTTQQLIRIINAGSSSPLSLKATIYPYQAQEAISCRVVDPYDGSVYIMSIPVGASTSNPVIFAQGSTTLIEQLDGVYSPTIQSPIPGAIMAYDILVDEVGTYPLPI